MIHIKCKWIRKKGDEAEEQQERTGHCATFPIKYITQSWAHAQYTQVLWYQTYVTVHGQETISFLGKCIPHTTSEHNIHVFCCSTVMSIALHSIISGKTTG
jgi:hypothetical protein